MKTPWRPGRPERIRPGLERILAAFAMTGHPERSFRIIHIAGTNGKGATARFSEAILRMLVPDSVGLYTSPHLLSPEERIRVGGEKIPPREFSRYAKQVADLSRSVGDETGEPLSYFEELTWIASDWFRRRKASLVAMETGLGGRWDATNACIPLVSVITNVGLDHREWLGGTLGRIAFEKAGILREKTPAILGTLRPSARKVIARTAREKGCEIWEANRDFRWEGSRSGRISLHLPGVTVEGARVGPAGEFQRENAAIACAAVWKIAIARGASARDFKRAARAALAEVKWPGRFSPLPGKKNAGVWVDGAHNPDAAAALGRELLNRRASARPARIIALWSMLGDKDIARFLKVLSPAVDGFVAYPMERDRAAPLHILSGELKRTGTRYMEAESFSDGWFRAKRWAGKGGMVIVCGSLMAAADAYLYRVGDLP